MTIDEVEFQKKMLEYIQKQKLNIGEERQQRIAQLASDVIKIMNTTAFEGGKHRWYDRQWILARLKEFNRLQPEDKNEDMFWVVNVPLYLGRLVSREYPNDFTGENVEKFVYNIHYGASNVKQKPMYSNPFE
jgi:hypothetical protein